ncbi:unnamed protein product [Arctia plantaginis]|uniref:Ig-like domain-containing protein n=1 Tax=Arctia plantaginis TaxID=874455 RepID=A0A8S0ZTX3_ARCPL|nr:unnamed protein product [Arctia plantaginis]
MFKLFADNYNIYTLQYETDSSPNGTNQAETLLKNFFPVTELPSKPVVFDEYGKEISGTAGPYHEGGEFKLICSVTGGYPIPRIQWLQGETVLATLSAGEVMAPTRSLALVIRNATRAHLSALYTCTADNTLLSSPQKTTVKIDLFLKPLTVEIISREQPLSVGRQSELWCKTTGARPPATITWWLGGKKLEAITKETDVEDANETESLLKWMPMKEHNEKVLTCRAEHSNFNRSSIESLLKLNVYYMPESTIHLGAKMNPNDIEEGDDVYFGCKVDANPPAYKVVWEHNGILLQHNPSNGVIVTGNTNLALRNVSRHQAGQYTCTASNVEGDGKSPYLHMQVVYRPLCKNKEIKIMGAALQEPTTVTCEVEAYPPPETFEWTLNNSAGSIKVDPDRFTVDAKQGKSLLTYTPVSDVDYGSLSCRAMNLAGQQVTPCVYTLLPATRPDPPTNCTVYNLTDDSLDLLCIPGYEGGLQCIYVVEVWATEGLVVNASNGVALWNLRRLGANRQLKLIVYAANARGRSEHITLQVETAFRLLPRSEPQEAWEVNWALGVFLGTALTIALILCLALIATKVRSRSRDYEVTLPTLKNQMVVVQKRSSTQGADDKNPDLIPLSKGLTEAPPDPPLYSAIAAPKNSSSTHSLQRTQTPVTPISSHAHYTDMQNDSGRSMINGAMRSHREIVTTRTPLLAAHQESCV